MNLMATKRFSTRYGWLAFMDNMVTKIKGWESLVLLGRSSLLDPIIHVTIKVH